MTPLKSMSANMPKVTSTKRSTAPTLSSCGVTDMTVVMAILTDCTEPLSVRSVRSRRMVRMDCVLGTPAYCT